MSLIEKFKKINKKWPNKSIKIPYENLSKLELFEIGYLAASDVPFRCFSIKLNPGDEHLKDVALLYNSKNKQFISLLNKEDGLVITLFQAEEESIQKNIDAVKEEVIKYKKQFSEKNEKLREQLSNCILVERKVDEAMHFALSKSLNRKVYFAIGECRERAALIPIFQNSQGADLVQLALHKWMDFTLRQPQDEVFPENNVTALVKNFLQIKKWLRDLIVKNLAGISTLKKEESAE